MTGGGVGAGCGGLVGAGCGGVGTAVGGRVGFPPVTGAIDTGAEVGELTGGDGSTIHGAEDVSGLHIIPGQHGFP